MTSRISGSRAPAAAGTMIVLCASFGLVACTDPVVPNYNNPVPAPLISTMSELQSQATGIAAGDRENHAFQILIMETMGRDAYRIDAADPRYINNPLGQFNPSAFIANFLWNSHYKTVRSANDLTNAMAGSSIVSAAQKAGTFGYAETFKAHQYMRLIEMRDTIGVPIVLGKEGQIDPIRCKPAVLAYISAALDSASDSLKAAGASFAFVVPGGFSSNGTFNTPAGYLQFNRGLKAKNEVYRGFANYAKSGTAGIDAAALNRAIAALNASFVDVNGNYRDGVYHLFSTSSGDLVNQNFDNSVYRANPKVLNEAEPGDARLSKVRRDTTAILKTEGVSSDILFTSPTGPSTPIPLLINEELLLVKAEALWGLGNDAGALAIVNAVRTKSGGFPTPLPPFADRTNLLREILKQKRYSLLFESPSRAIDYRMFGLWSELGLERTAPATPTLGPMVIPLTEAEANARNNILTCTT